MNAHQNVILLGETGSGAHGLALEGKDDQDLMGVCIPPPDYVIGLKHFEQHIKRDQSEGVKSQPGDTDLVIYSLQKWISLALRGNPSILVLLFVEPLQTTGLGGELQSLAPSIISREAGPRFLGYLESQKQRLLGEKGQARLPNRGGQHRKYASHMVRLGYQGVEVLTTGRMSLPMEDGPRKECLAIKTGDLDVDYALNRAGELANEIKDLLDEPEGLVPDHPNRDRVDEWLIRAHFNWWRAQL